MKKTTFFFKSNPWNRYDKFLVLSFLCLLSHLPYQAIAQTNGQAISGNVRDVNNEGIPGVTVVVEDSKQGTITDLKGAYQLKVSGANDVLIFTAIGMETVRESVGTRTTIDVIMKEESKALEMVVVSALGFTENRDKQGSATTKVDPKTVTRSGESGLLQGLAGKASGVRITRSTGDPGAGSNFQIRGANTITGASQPLIILDGIPISNSNTTGFGATATGVGVAQQSRSVSSVCRSSSQPR